MLFDQITQKTDKSKIMKYATEQIEPMAKAFSAELLSELGQKNMTIVIERNQTEEYKGACATHDFCDANQVFLDAHERFFNEEMEVLSNESISFTNRVWDLAKKNNFYL